MLDGDSLKWRQQNQRVELSLANLGVLFETLNSMECWSWPSPDPFGIDPTEAICQINVLLPTVRIR